MCLINKHITAIVNTYESFHNKVLYNIYRVQDHVPSLTKLHINEMFNIIRNNTFSDTHIYQVK